MSQSLPVPLSGPSEAGLIPLATDDGVPSICRMLSQALGCCLGLWGAVLTQADLGLALALRFTLVSSETDLDSESGSASTPETLDELLPLRAGGFLQLQTTNTAPSQGGWEVEWDKDPRLSHRTQKLI